MRPTAVVSNDGTERPADTIIFGTGFSATDFLRPMKVFGRGGVELSDVWSDGAATHLGIVTAGFPNLFLMGGPNTALGHNSIVFMVEAQTRYIVSAVRHMRDARRPVLEIACRVQDATYADVQQRMKKTVWVSGCRSWYLSDGGRNDIIRPATTVEYWWRTRRFRPADFR